MQLTQALMGVLIGLSIILVLQVVGAIIDHYSWKAAMARFEQDLRDHPPSTATSSRPIVSGSLKQ